MNDLNLFLDLKSFRPLSDLEKFKPNYKGLYALQVKDASILPSPFREELFCQQTNLIYIGKGERTIYRRLLEECFGKGHGTFFRGMGALLNFKPEKGSLLNMQNKNNYRFSKADATKIVEWMNRNLEVSFLELDIDINKIEKNLIQANFPILNSTHNSKKSKHLSDLRKACRDYACSI